MKSRICLIEVNECGHCDGDGKWDTAQCPYCKGSGDTETRIDAEEWLLSMTMKHGVDEPEIVE